MAKVQLNQKEQWYADTREEAEEIVTAAKDNDSLIMNKISEKYNKYGQYFLVDLTYQHNTPKEVMEKRPKKDDDAPDGQMNIDEVHEGVEYSIDQDGSVSVATKEDVESDEEEIDLDSIQFENPGEEDGEKKTIDELEQELPF